LLHKDNLKQNIKFANGEFFFKGETMKGDAAHVKILAPSTLYRPYLTYRLNDEYSYLGLCRTCIVEKNAKECKHMSADKRAFTSCYQITDLAKAVSLGYEILEWYEVHHYQKREYLLSDFVRVLASQKLRQTNIFDNISEHSKVQFCDELNTKMNFGPNLKLTPDNICDNPAQKQLYKDMLNSFFGRFALHTNFTQHHFCKTLQDIERIASKPDTQIVDILSISDDVCEIEVVSPTQIKPSQSGNLYITSEINALARKFIYEQSELIESVQGIILSCDTDAIVYSLPPGVSDPLTYTPAFGDFKPVLGTNCQIESFYSLGPRNYSIVYKDATGCEQHLMKVKGLSTLSANTFDVISPEKYEDFIEKRFNSEVENIYLPQMRKKIEKQTKKFHEILTHFNFGNEIHVKRYIIKNDPAYKSYPYGFKFLK
jgi:hypothetical protein